MFGLFKKAEDQRAKVNYDEEEIYRNEIRRDLLNYMDGVLQDDNLIQDLEIKTKADLENAIPSIREKIKYAILHGNNLERDKLILQEVKDEEVDNLIRENAQYKNYLLKLE